MQSKQKMVVKKKKKKGKTDDKVIKPIISNNCMVDNMMVAME